MGLILSRASNARRKGAKESLFERELAQLDADISRHEIDLAETRIAQRRTSVYLFFYSMLVVVAAWAFVFFVDGGAGGGRGRRVWLDLGLVVGVPVAIFYGRRGVSWFYKRRILGLEVALQTLRQRQHLKLEELKDSSGYYQTRGLIERFDPEFKRTAIPQINIEPTIASKPTPGEPEQPPRQGKQAKEAPKDTLNVLEEKVAFVLPVEPKKTWMDRLVDAMIGDDSRHSKYALICKRCHAHNGLALPDEIMNISFVCPNCHYENHPRKRDNLVINGENVYTPVKDDDGGAVEVKADPDTPQALRRRKN